MEADIDHGTDVTRVGIQLFGQFLGRITWVAILLVHHEHFQDFLIQLVYQFGSYQRTIGSILLFLFC